MFMVKFFMAQQGLLCVDVFCIPIERSSTYKNAWLVKGTKLYIHQDYVQPLRGPAPKAAPPGVACYMPAREPVSFAEFYRAFTAGGRTLYRGLASSHRQVDNILKGKLVSEGDADILKYTADDDPKAPKTRWLPCADTDAVPYGVALSGGFERTDLQHFPENAHVGTCRELSMEHPVPMGYVIRVTVSRAKTFPVCWFDPGETQARGALSYPDFEVDRVCWYSAGHEVSTPWPAAARHAICPQRPYRQHAKFTAAWLHMQAAVWTEQLCKLDPATRHAIWHPIRTREVLEAAQVLPPLLMNLIGEYAVPGAGDAP